MIIQGRDNMTKRHFKNGLTGSLGMLGILLSIFVFPGVLAFAQAISACFFAVSGVILLIKAFIDIRREF